MSPAPNLKKLTTETVIAANIHLLYPVTSPQMFNKDYQQQENELQVDQRFSTHYWLSFAHESEAGMKQSKVRLFSSVDL